MNRRSHPYGCFHELTQVALACLIVLSIAATQPKAFSQILSKRSIAKVGDQAPDFTLSDFNGKNFSLSGTLKSKSVLLWFTNLCQGCQSQLDEVQSLRSQYEKKGIEVIAVSVLGEDRTTVEEVMLENNMAFRFLYDPKGEITKRYSGTYIEGTCPLKNIFVITKDRTITFASHLPGVSRQELTDQVDRITKGTKE